MSIPRGRALRSFALDDKIRADEFFEIAGVSSPLLLRFRVLIIEVADQKQLTFNGSADDAVVKENPVAAVTA